MDKIKTRTEFVHFVRCLKKDCQENFSSWENRDLESFLEAVASWTEDMDGFYQRLGLSVPERPDWSVFANILMGGKMYE